MVLVLAMLVISGLATLMAAAFQRTATELRAAERYVAKQQAFHLAEGAVDRMLAELAGGGSGTAASAPLGLAAGTVVATVEEIGSTQRIVGTGSATLGPDASQQITVTVPARQSVFRYTLFGNDAVIISPQAHVTGDVRTNSTANGAVQIGSWASLDGAIVLGVGGNPNTVVQVASVPGFQGEHNGIQGTYDSTATAAATEAFPMPAIEPPEGSPCGSPLSVPNGTKVLDLSDPVSSCYSSITVGGSGKVRIVGEGNLILTGLTMESGGQISVEGEANIVTNGVAAGLQGQLGVTSSGELKLYVTEKIELGIQDIVGSDDTRKLAIFYSGTQDVKLGIQTNFKGVVYAPNATISPDPQGFIRGALVGKRVVVDPQAFIYEDPNLAEWEAGMIGEGSGTSVRDVLSWTQ
jgi:hypothetical protein